MKRVDVLIVGAGPAGIATAIELGSAGWNVMLVDKSFFPRDKVCGGFIGPENKFVFEQLGILNELFKRGAEKVTHIHLSAPNGKDVRVPLLQRGKDESGIALSRKSMDQVLLEKALSLGVTFLDGTVLAHEEFSDGLFTCSLRKSGEENFFVKAPYLIYATGTGSDYKSKDARIFGVSGIFDSAEGLDHSVAMHFIDGGHAGINRLENGINVCYVIKESLFKKCNGSYEIVWQHFLEASPVLKTVMQNSKQIGKWKGTFVDMDKPLKFYEGNAFYIGDAAGLIHPVAGGGISLALMSGSLLGRLMASAQYTIDRQEIARKYEELWRKNFQSSTNFSKWIGQISHNKFFANTIVGLLRLRPKTIQEMFDVFHQPDQPRSILWTQ